MVKNLISFYIYILSQLNGFLRLKKDWELIKNVHDDFMVVDDLFWEKIDELVQTLEFPFLATKAMENRNFCYTDLYLWSMRIEIKLNRIIENSPHFNFAAILKTKLKERERNLFNTPIMMTALYLDPRFRKQLTATETSIAVETLHKMFIQIKSKPLTSPRGLNAIDRQIEAQIFLDQQLQQTEAHLRSELTMAMSNYNAAQITDINRNAIDFWKDNKQLYPQLYEISRIVFSIASSISETERTFSGFSYIYNVRRMNLLPKNVTNILMVRLNKDVFYQLKESKIKNIKEI